MLDVLGVVWASMGRCMSACIVSYLSGRDTVVAGVVGADTSFGIGVSC